MESVNNENQIPGGASGQRRGWLKVSDEKRESRQEELTRTGKKIIKSWKQCMVSASVSARNFLAQFPCDAPAYFFHI